MFKTFNLEYLAFLLSSTNHYYIEYNWNI